LRLRRKKTQLKQRSLRPRLSRSKWQKRLKMPLKPQLLRLKKKSRKLKRKKTSPKLKLLRLRKKSRKLKKI